MFDTLVTWLLVPLGMALGWVLARRTPTGSESAARVESFSGIRHLVNDDSDQALASLIKATEQDEQAAELHLTLGSLFRKRGEVDRALRVHEALLGRSQLPAVVADQVHYELAQDYLKAGMMDRAEALFQALADQGKYVVASLEALVGIAESGRDWARAIDASRRLQAASGQSRQAITAQYLCELADEALRSSELDKARQLARQALDEDGDCVRAELLLGHIYEKIEQRPAAIRALQRIPELDERFIPEIIEPMWRCYRELGDFRGFIEFLQQLRSEHPSGAAVLKEIELMQETGVDPTEHLAKAFAEHPSWRLLQKLLATMQLPGDAVMAKAVQTMRETLDATAAQRPRYRCSHCGFQPGLMFWQCPSCKQWGSVVPASDLLADVQR